MIWRLNWQNSPTIHTGNVQGKVKFKIMERKISSLKETGFKKSLKWTYLLESDLKEKNAFSIFTWREVFIF